MRRAIFLASARTDLIQILDHIADVSGSVSTAERFVAQLRRRCDELAGLPGTLGRARPELRPDLRSVSHKGYVILFRHVGADFEVVNIIEGHRDIDALFNDSGH